MKLKDHHPDVSLKIDCRHIKSGLNIYDRILLTHKCMIMTNEKGAIYMVAAMA
jgi:hypothetical protein